MSSSNTAGPRRHHRVWLWLGLTLLVLVLVIRIVADPLAAHFTRKGLNEADGIRGDFSKVHVSFLPPGYEIHHLKLIQDPGGHWAHPLLYVERAQVHVITGQLLKGHLVAAARIESPKIIFVPPPSTGKPASSSPPDIAATLNRVTPLRVDRVEITHGQFLLHPGSPSDPAELWIHELELVVENIATRRELMKTFPLSIMAHAQVQRSGVLTAFFTIDPFTKFPSFSGRTELRALSAKDLWAFIAPSTGLQPTQGTISVFIEAESKNGVISGGVKPVLSKIEVSSAGEKLGDRVKAWLADKALALTSDRVEGRDAVATVVPIKGRLTDPDIQVWPALLGVVRNAFVVGLTSGFSHLPPPTAPAKEGAVKQVADALKKDAGPPKAQPVHQGRAPGSKGN